MSSPPGWLRTLRGTQPRLWLLAVLLYGVGDGVTTALGLRDGGAAEVGPLAGTAVSQAGIGGLVALKLVFFAVCLAAWYRLRTPGRVAIPLAIAAVGLAVTAWNLAVLLL